MSKRISDAERVIGFFKSAPLPTAQVLLDLAKAELKARGGVTMTKKTPTKARTVAATPLVES